MAPMNIGVSVLAVTPAAAQAPMMAPLSPYTILPPEQAIRIGSKNRCMGETRAFSVSFGHQPVGMNSAVMIPQAMKMEIFGMTIPERNRPKVCSFCFMILSSFFLS